MSTSFSPQQVQAWHQRMVFMLVVACSGALIIGLVIGSALEKRSVTHKADAKIAALAAQNSDLQREVSRKMHAAPHEPLQHRLTLDALGEAIPRGATLRELRFGGGEGEFDGDSTSLATIEAAYNRVRKIAGNPDAVLIDVQAHAGGYAFKILLNDEAESPNEAAAMPVPQPAPLGQGPPAVQSAVDSSP